MIPGLSTGGGSISDASPTSSSLDVKQSYESHLGGNAGVTFGRSRAESLAWPIAIAAVALFYFLNKNRGG